MFLKLETKIESFSSLERCFITTFRTDMFDEINFIIAIYYRILEVNEIDQEIPFLRREKIWHQSKC